MALTGVYPSVGVPDRPYQRLNVSYPRGNTTLGTLTRGAWVWTDAMVQGTVDFFNQTGGYGFISTDESDDDVFFHMEDVGGDDLDEGTDIEFEIEQAPKGPRATNVVRV